MNDEEIDLMAILDFGYKTEAERTMGQIVKYVEYIQKEKKDLEENLKDLQAKIFYYRRNLEISLRSEIEYDKIDKILEEYFEYFEIKSTSNG